MCSTTLPVVSTILLRSVENRSKTLIMTTYMNIAWFRIFFGINYHTESPIYFRISKYFSQCVMCAKKPAQWFRECYYLTCYTLYINVLGDNSGIFHCYHQLCQSTHWLRCRNAPLLACILPTLPSVLFTVLAKSARRRRKPILKVSSIQPIKSGRWAW